MKTPHTQTARLGEQPAFPTNGYNHGLTFRQYLIGQAIQGLAALQQLDANQIADEALRIADAVLFRLAREHGSLCVVPRDAEPMLDLDELVRPRPGDPDYQR